MATNSGMFPGPYFTSRAPVRFICDDDPTLSIRGDNNNYLFNNPKVFVIQTGTYMQMVPTINGVCKITGFVEYAPFQLQIQWPQLAYSDYLKLSALTPYYLTFISHRGLGYYGAMTLSGPSAQQPYTSDVVSCTATFFVLGPSDDGGASQIARVGRPGPLTCTDTSGGGYINASTTNWYMLTYHTKWGESLATKIKHTTGSGGSNYSVTVGWKWNYYLEGNESYITYASLYSSPDGSIANAKLMAEVLKTQDAQWVDLVGHAGVSPPGVALYQQPPTVDTAYAGAWQGGIWTNAPGLRIGGGGWGHKGKGKQPDLSGVNISSSSTATTQITPANNYDGFNGLQINNNGTFTSGGGGSIKGGTPAGGTASSVTIASGGTFAFGSSIADAPLLEVGSSYGGTGTMAVNGTLSMAANAFLQLAPTANATLTINSGYTLGFSSTSGSQMVVDGVTLTINANVNVPDDNFTQAGDGCLALVTWAQGSGETVQFTDGSFLDGTTGTIASWAWDFGDGSGTSTSQNPSYTYAQGGTYLVTLTITTTDGDTSTVTVQITLS